MTKRKIEIMKELTRSTGLTYDGDDNRLFLDEMENYNVAAMGPDVYEKWENDLHKIEIKGEGFIVSAWNDSSGYEYWLREGTNYQQTTVYILDFELALKHKDTIIKAVQDLDYEFRAYCLYTYNYAGFPTPDEIKEAQDELEKSVS